MPANRTTCDIYRNGNTPPAAADVSGVVIELTPAFEKGRNATPASNFVFTHIATMPFSTDVRDGYTGNILWITQDTVYIPDNTGTAFLVRFVEVVGRGTSDQKKRVYLDRATPTWPTNHL